MALRFRPTGQFDKDMKVLARRGLDLDLLEDVVERLRRRERLPRRFQDHSLVGKYRRNRECHVAPDWLLVYRVEGDELIAVRTGSHSDLF